MQYYIKRCEDPELRVKMAEQKKVQYRERKIKECGSEVLYEMCRPGRPRKYQAAAALELIEYQHLARQLIPRHTAQETNTNIV